MSALAVAQPLVVADTGWRVGLARYRQNRVAVAGAVVLLAVVLMAVFAGPIGLESPLGINLNAVNQPPSWAHILGTDAEGRDIWSRLVHGSQVSLIIAAGAVALYTVIGVVLGSLAGFYRGWLDAAIMRCTDMALSFPLILIAIVAVSVLGPGILQLILVIGLIAWPTMARLVRGQFLSLRETDFVVAARSVGVSDVRIIVRHILPNTLGVVVVNATFGMAYVILLESSLSFLGLGVQPPTASWGNMLTAAQSFTVLQSMPWQWIPPAVMIFLTITSINFVGDGLRDVVDPHSAKR